MKRTTVSVKNTLRNSEFVNENATLLFNNVAESVIDQVTLALGIETDLYGAIYRPTSNSRVYSAKSMFLWVYNMIYNEQTTTMGITFRDGSRAEFDVNICNNGDSLFVNVDLDSISYTRLSPVNKLKAVGFTAMLVAGCFGI